MRRTIGAGGGPRFDLCHCYLHRFTTSTAIRDHRSAILSRLAIPAVTLLGLGKGGFAGVGMISTPILALFCRRCKARRSLLPILFLCQDAISVWTYRRAWGASESQSPAERRHPRHGREGLVRKFVSHAAIELTAGASGWHSWSVRWLGNGRGSISARGTRAAPAERRARRSSGARRRLHLGAGAGGRAAVTNSGPAPQRLREAHAGRHHGSAVRLRSTLLKLRRLISSLGQLSPRNFATSIALLPTCRRRDSSRGIWLVLANADRTQFYKSDRLFCWCFLDFYWLCSWQGGIAAAEGENG